MSLAALAPAAAPRRRWRLPALLPMLSVVWLIVVVAVCIAGPRLVTGFDPEAVDYDATYAQPAGRHWAGTDALGRDQAARLIQGGRISLKIALAATIISLLAGVTVGAVAGYFGGKIDMALMRLVDVLYGVPTVLVVILLMVYLDQGIRNIYLAIGLTYWLNVARITRGQVLALRQREFVSAARALGAGPLQVILRHLMPNSLPVILVAVLLFVPEAIFLEAFLSYIGLGVPAPDASWGTLAAEGARSMRSAPYLMLYPALVIVSCMMAFNVCGEWLSARVARRSAR